MRNRIVWSIVLVLALAVPLIPAAAQDDDGLGEDERALLERIVAARAQVPDFTSYIETNEGSDSQVIVIRLEGQEREIVEATTWERTETVIRGETDNAAAEIAVTYEASDLLPNGQEESSALSASGEARLVDGVIYLNASVESTPPGGVPTLPEGWFVVEDPAGTDLFDLMGLDDLADAGTGESPFEDPDFILANASSVTLETVTLDDGTPADAITIVFKRGGLLGLMDQGEANLLTMALLEGIDEESGAVMTAYLDGDNMPVGMEMMLRMQALDMDAHALSPDDFPEGMTLDFIFEQQETQTFAEINVEREPVAAPEIVAAE